MPKAILLIQDDAPGTRSVQKAMLRSGDDSIRIEWVRRCSEALERLMGQGKERDDIAAIIVDLFLPDSRGIATFDRLFRAAPDTPILVLSEPLDEDTARLAVQLGAQDYLLKNRIDSYALSKSLRCMIERAVNAEALYEEKERAQVTLDSIGDAVISTDTVGRVTYINAIAERLTGWSREEASGRSFAEVFRVVKIDSREVAPDPMALAIPPLRSTIAAEP